MAQHDYNIANASFPTVRTDLNNVLSAINSTNSGSSRPSSAVAGTIWLDTSGAATAQLLKMYDGAGDITLGTVNFTANTVDWSDSSITLADNSVTLAKMASGTDGNIISYDASGDPVAVATGSDGQVLTSAGAGSPPAFEDTILFKQEGTNFTDSLIIGHTTTGTLNNAQKNLAVGKTSLAAITTGDENVALGYGSLGQTTSGAQNVAIGIEAGAQNSASNNVLIGFRAGQQASANQNVGVGYQSLKVVSGINNVGLGYEAGDNITSGKGNVMIGSGVDAASATGDKQLKITGNDGSTATTWISGDSNGQVKLISGYIAEVALTDATTITWNAATQPVAKVTLGASRTMGLPANPVSGQFISLLIIQDGTGSRTITWNAAYEFAADTAPTLTATANLGDLFTFRYNGAKWLEVGRNLALTLS